MTSEPLRTGDGSFTLRHPVVGEAYHSLDGAFSEARNKFLIPSRLSERRSLGPVRLLDVGFGLGVNCRCALESPGSFTLHIDSLENDPQALDRALQLAPEDPLLLSLQTSGAYRQGQNQVNLHPGDMRVVIQNLPGPYDLIFHDPFSPMRNSECWTVELFREFFLRLSPDGALLTYSQSKIVRAALQAAGFQVQDTPPLPPHRGGTIAVKQGAGIEPLSVIPFRDPELNASGHEIRSRREAAQRAAGKPETE
ncbi:MAG: tRNA (5-methylaminomethyl-2-thiouridine)(34)-methyltransferase MnmD [Kiritimatiellia bacterium]